MTQPVRTIDETAPTATDLFSPARLRGHLDGLDLPRAEVAARIGCTEAELSCYEDGVTQPPVRVRAALAAMLGVTVEAFDQQCDDWADDYVDAVACYCQPETDAELDAAATALRILQPIVDRHRRATVAAWDPELTDRDGRSGSCAESEGTEQMRQHGHSTPRCPGHPA